MSAATSTAADAERLSPAQASKVKTLGLAALVIGLVLMGAGYAGDSKRFAFSYLVGFMYVATLGLGGLFFVLIQHLVRAGWSVAARRQMEWLAGFLPICVILFIPVLVFSHDIYHHWMGPQAAADPILIKKAKWLNPTFFYVRAFIYLGIWSALATFFRSTSKKQDTTGDSGLTLRMEAVSAPGMLLFGVSISFAAFDWMMSLDPHWFSTIFGLYVFAGSVLSSFALLALMTMSLTANGLFNNVSTVEHQHDIGKFMLGFTVFWAYIAFSQFFLIWYANLPEEITFFLNRWENGWKPLSYLLLFGHFVIPFLWLLPRTMKRIRLTLSIGAVWLLVMHFVDLYWNIMPNFAHGGEKAVFHFSWVDIAGWLGPVGVLLFWLSTRVTSENLYPLKDPRLEETYKVDNP